MFNWLKRKRSLLDKWNFGVIADFEMIQNSDSIQYVNKDGTKAIYFSELKVSGNGVFPIDSYAGKSTITENVDGWQLKGTKVSENQVLVCVISVSKQDDVEWAKMFFDSITSH